MTRVGLAGPGRVGRTIAALLPADDYKLGPVLSSSYVAARRAVREMKIGAPARNVDDLGECDLILISSPEKSLRPLLDELAASPRIKDETVVLHTAGICDSYDGLNHAKQRLSLACFYPLQVFQRPLADLAGVYFILAGDAAAVRAARSLAQALGGRFGVANLNRKGQACVAATLASDVLTAILEFGVRRLISAGLRRRRAVEALEMMIQRTMMDFERSGLKSRPGPLLRGDAAEVLRRVDVCDGVDPAEGILFRQALQLSLDIMERSDAKEPPFRDDPDDDRALSEIGFLDARSF